MKSVNFASAVAMSLALTVPVAHAQLAPPVDAIDVNLVGIGIGSVPDYSGSDNNTGAAAPIVRYQFQGSERYFLWLGPTMQVNLLDDKEWRLGPMLNYRGKRDSDVDDPVVSQMNKIDAKVEAGAFVQYNLQLSSAKMHKVTFTGDVAGSSNGTAGSLRMMYWQPFSQEIIGNIGIGAKFANDKFFDKYYGIKDSDIALFPSLGGQRYKADGGLLSVNVPFGVSMLMSKEWLVSVGGRFERLQGDAKDSPIVSERGDKNQWVFGAGLSYLF